MRLFSPVGALCSRARGHRLFLGAVLTLALIVLLPGVSVRPLPTRASSWTLAWSDEFAGAAGALPNPAVWNLETGGDGWGNHELETYTGRPQNVALDGQGHMNITARRETYTGDDGITRDYTSARLTTQHKFTQRYGRFEARMKIPPGQGTWPAFWMLGDNTDIVSWPQGGEIDVMESVGNDPGTVWGSIHGPGYTDTGITGGYTLPNGAQLADAYHLYAVEWSPTRVSWYLDDVLYETRTPADLPPGAPWVFDHPFFLLVNLAIGGDWPGSPDATTPFPAVLQVDYIRTYQLADSPATSTPAPASSTPAASPTPCTAGVFSDVPGDNPFYPYVTCLAGRGIVGGYADCTYRPGGPVTRGQMAKLIANAAGYGDPIPATQQTFGDVPPADPFWLYIERAAAHGVISGYGNGTYQPGNAVTRGQVAKLVSNAAGYSDLIPAAQQTFGDVPPADPFWLYVERAAAHGVISGYSDATYRPEAGMTRSQTAKVIAITFFPICTTSPAPPAPPQHRPPPP